MAVILGIVAPVFLIIALGYAAAKRGLVDRAGFTGLNTFAFALASPALLFLGGTTGTVGGGRAALAFFIGTAAIYAGTLLAARRVGGRPLGAAGMLALDATFGNTVMMGIPLITAAFGAEALAVLLAILALHSMVLLGVATVVAEIGLHARAPWRRVLRATVAGVGRNPIVMAVAAALVWRLLGLPAPPGFVRRALELLGAAGPPVALFCLGGSLAALDPRAAWRETLAAGSLKLFAMPAVVWAVCVALDVPRFETAVTVVTAALPTGANAFLLAQRYRIEADRSGATVLVSTAVSVVTLSALLTWFRA
jgi:malonate transporter and related proteins